MSWRRGPVPLGGRLVRADRTESGQEDGDRAGDPRQVGRRQDQGRRGDRVKTAALLDQKIASLSAEKGWWLDMLMRGELPWGCDAADLCPTQRLFGQFRHAGKVGVKRRAIETQLGMFLSKHVPNLRKVEGQYLTRLCLRPTRHVSAVAPIASS
jgi:hypothetical protein